MVEKVEFPFAAKAAEIFRRRAEGSPHLRQFNSIYADSPRGRMRIAFKKRYLKIYTVDQSAESEKVLEERLGDLIVVSKWGSENTKNQGFTFTVETEEQFERFLQGLGER